MATNYGDISPRTAGKAAKELLKRAVPFLVLEMFGQSKPIDKNSTKTQIFRRYNALDPTPKPLTEGVTPTAKKLTKTDVVATLVQYGDRIELSDVVMDTHEDPVLMESVDILGEQAGQMLEIVRFGVVKAGTNVFYSTGSARASVDAAISTAFQRRVTRALKRQNARVITSRVSASPNYATEPVAPSFIGMCHPDVENDIRDMDGFVPVEKYGTVSPYPNEIGKVEDCRYLTTTIMEPWLAAGAAVGATGMIGVTNIDVYPVLYVGRDAYGIVPFKGDKAVTPMIVNPKPSDSDPMAQRGHAAWKAMHTAVILNDLWMVRGEVAVKS